MGVGGELWTRLVQSVASWTIAESVAATNMTLPPSDCSALLLERAREAMEMEISEEEEVTFM